MEVEDAVEVVEDDGGGDEDLEVVVGVPGVVADPLLGGGTLHTTALHCGSASCTGYGEVTTKVPPSDYGN